MALESFTPLETLLLFQTLQSTQGSPPSFQEISNVLKSNELILESESFAQNRLEPESLREHYLHVLKEEAKVESQRAQPAHRESLSPSLRKQSSQPSEEVDEPALQKYLSAKLVNRLYFRYRDYALKSIEEEERQYRSLQREIQEIERGDWDARLNRETATRRDSRGVSSIHTILRHDGDDNHAQSGSHAAPNAPDTRQNGFEIRARSREKSPTTNGLDQVPVARGSQHPPIDHKRVETPGYMENNATFRPPPQPIKHGYAVGSPSSDISRKLPPPNSFQSHAMPSSSSHVGQKPLPPAERSSASPVILPPPPGMLRSSGSPTGPLDTLADMAGQQYRASPVIPSPRMVQPPGPQQAHQLPQPRNYGQRGYPYYENQPPYQAQYSPYAQGPPSASNHQHQPGSSPYQGTVMNAGPRPPYSNIPQYQPPMPQYSQQFPGYNQAHGYYPSAPNQPPYARGPVQALSEQQTPVATPSNRQRPVQPTPITTSTSSTKWKHVSTPGSIRHPSPRSPSPGAISPISDKAPSLSPGPRLSSTKSAFDNRALDSPNQTTRGKSGRGRGTSRRGRGGRAPSVTSSVHPESSTARTRSQSVTSQADELSIDQIPSTRKIKPDPSLASVHEDDVATASPMADEDGRKSGRRGRGNRRSIDVAESGRAASKRKRQESVNIPPPSPAPAVTSKPGYVLGTRNFPKIAAPLMNDISTHKLGNLFAKPLTDREAPGYKDLVYQPQDLRSIKLAMNAGGRALVKAAESLGEDGNSSSVWIPETPEVVPPAGIVNSTQLEKELMRIFANAVMFNPEVPSKRGVGPAFRTRQRTLAGAVDEEPESLGEEEIVDGKQDVSVVKDAREIFEAVEEKVAAWRSAEKPSEGGSISAKGSLGRLRGGGSEEADELAGNGDDVLGSVEQEPTPEPRSKRRRR